MIRRSAGDITRLLAADLRGDPGTPVVGVAIDSRAVQPGNLFVALPGARVDGCDFAPAAAGAGAAAALLGRPLALDLPQIVTPDPLAALQRLAAVERSEAAYRLAAVTGSIGKTTTKEFLTALLGTSYPVGCTSGNRNSETGFPVELCNQAEGIAWMVAELGMSHAGELDRLGAIAQPDAVLITVVAPVHLEFFPDIEAVAAAKAELIRHLNRDGTLVLNARDPRVAGVEDERAVAVEVADELRLGRGDRLDVGEELEVDRRHHGDQHRVGLGDGAETVEFAGVAHAEFGHHPGDPLGLVAQLDGEAGLGVAVAARAPDRVRSAEQRGQELLGGRLADRARDRGEAVRGLGALDRGEALQRGERVRRHDLGQVESERTAQEGGRRPGAGRRGREVATVDTGPRQRHEQVAGLHGARVDRDPDHRRARIAPQVGGEQARDVAGAAADHARLLCASSRTTARSSNGTVRSAKTCSVSWPLPATNTMQRSSASESAAAIASRRSGIARARGLPEARTPATTWSMIACGSSLRGLSEVTTGTSASRPTVSPIEARLPGSRSPPQPNTTTRRFSPTSRSASRTCSSASGVWA